MKFKIGDKVIYRKKEYTITEICTCPYCKTRPGGTGFVLNTCTNVGNIIAYPCNLHKAEPKIGEQLEFAFMKD